MIFSRSGYLFIHCSKNNLPVTIMKEDSMSFLMMSLSVL